MKVHAAGTLKLSECVLTIGALDGVHRGHRSLIEQARERAERYRVPLVVYTFDPPPKAFFHGAPVLTSLEEKLRRLDRLGADHVVVAPFNADYMSRGVAAFIEELETLRPIEIWEGADFRFGRERDGGIDTLKGKFSVHVIEPVKCKANHVISSSRIRALIAEGDYEAAEELLGWKHFNAYPQQKGRMQT